MADKNLTENSRRKRITPYIAKKQTNANLKSNKTQGKSSSGNINAGVKDITKETGQDNKTTRMFVLSPEFLKKHGIDTNNLQLDLKKKTSEKIDKSINVLQNTPAIKHAVEIQSVSKDSKISDECGVTKIDIKNKIKSKVLSNKKIQEAKNVEKNLDSNEISNSDEILNTEEILNSDEFLITDEILNPEEILITEEILNTENIENDDLLNTNNILIAEKFEKADEVLNMHEIENKDIENEILHTEKILETEEILNTKEILNSDLSLNTEKILETEEILKTKEILDSNESLSKQIVFDPLKNCKILNLSKNLDVIDEEFPVIDTDDIIIYDLNESTNSAVLIDQNNVINYPNAKEDINNLNKEDDGRNDINLESAEILQNEVFNKINEIVFESNVIDKSVELNNLISNNAYKVNDNAESILIPMPEVLDSKEMKNSPSKNTDESSNDLQMPSKKTCIEDKNSVQIFSVSISSFKDKSGNSTIQKYSKTYNNKRKGMNVSNVSLVSEDSPDQSQRNIDESESESKHLTDLYLNVEDLPKKFTIKAILEKELTFMSNSEFNSITNLYDCHFLTDCLNIYTTCKIKSSKSDNKKNENQDDRLPLSENFNNISGLTDCSIDSSLINDISNCVFDDNDALNQSKDLSSDDSKKIDIDVSISPIVKKKNASKRDTLFTDSINENLPSIQPSKKTQRSESEDVIYEGSELFNVLPEKRRRKSKVVHESDDDLDSDAVHSIKSNARKDQSVNKIVEDILPTKRKRKPKLMDDYVLEKPIASSESEKITEKPTVANDIIVSEAESAEVSKTDLPSSKDESINPISDTSCDNVTNVDTTIDDEPIRLPKKKGRKPKIVNTQEPPREKRKVGRPRKIVEPDPVVSDTDDTEAIDEDVKAITLQLPKRGRPSNASKVNNSFTKSYNHYNPKADCKCSSCSQVFLLRNWDMHNMHKHNFLSWMVGSPPIDLTNDKLVFKLLQQKVKLGRALVCEKCPEVRASSHGFIAHMKICKKSAEEIEALKIKCDVCDSYVMPQSFQIHMRAHEASNVSVDVICKKTKRKAAVVAENSFKKIKLDDDDVDDKQTGTLYEKIPKLVVSPDDDKLWDDRLALNQLIVCPRFDCNHTETDKISMYHHYLKKCPLLPIPVFECLLCSCSFKKKAQILKHLKQKHKKVYDDQDLNDGEDFVLTDYSSSEEDTIETKNDKPTVISKLSEKFDFESTVSANYRTFHLNSGKKFVEEHFSVDQILPEFACYKYEPMSIADADKYLPERRISCNIAHSIYDDKNSNGQDIAWKNYNLFESELFNGSLTLWCGGPVWALSFIPGERETSFLAVAANRSMEQKFYDDSFYSHDNIIQIWDVGKLSNDNSKCVAYANMVFGIAHNHGVIWDMDCCPSGSEDDCILLLKDIDGKQVNRNDIDFLRMGLLAIACSDGYSYVYAVCHPKSLPQSQSRIYDTKPAVKLSLNIAGEKSIPQATKIFWSKNKGHNTIAVGYSNGLVALFDVSSKSPLLRSQSGYTVKLLPYYTFQPTMSRIKGLVILPEYSSKDEDALPTLAVSSSSDFSMWNGSTLLMQTPGRYSGMALSHPWPQVFTILDEIPNFSNKYMNGLIVSSAAFMGSQYRLTDYGMFPDGGSCDTNIWNNTVVTSNLCGEITITPLLTPIINSMKYMKYRKRATLCTTAEVGLKDDCLKNKDKNHGLDAITYDEAQSNYGLLFTDMPYITKLDIPIKVRYEAETIPLARWPMRSWLCSKSHPSQHAHWFHAHGGRSGQLRIMCTRHLTDFHYKKRKFNTIINF